MKRRGLLVLVLMTLVFAAGPMATAAAHEGGKVELTVLEVEATGAPGAVTVTALVVDADSAAPEPGFTTTLRAVPAEGDGLGPIAAGDLGNGKYSAELPLTEGAWTVTIAVVEGPTSEPAEPTTREVEVHVSPTEIDVHGGEGSSSGSNTVPFVGATVALVGVAAGLLGFRRGRDGLALRAR
jgi:hypothetical protein